MSSLFTTRSVHRPFISAVFVDRCEPQLGLGQLARACRSPEGRGCDGLIHELKTIAASRGGYVILM